MRSMQHFPLIGAAIGLWAAVFFNAAAVLFPQSIAAAVSTLATVHITGCFHEDGLADVFDGFGEAGVL
jgi:adenosylcobinamide-GDP ribazoletransferase